MNVNVDSKEPAMAVINELASSSEHHIVALDAFGNGNIIFTFDFMKSRLLQEEQRAVSCEAEMQKSTEKSAQVSNIALLPVSGFGQPTSCGSCKQKLKCINCKPEGHIASNC